MFNLENEVKNLREQNDELVQSLQYWKITAAQKENEKIDLIKEINELRMKLGRIRNGGATQLCQLDAALQAASQEALTHLVQASSAVARSMELAKAYVRDKQESDRNSLRWSTISGTPTSDRVNRVPPLLIGGQSIQPVVSLSRTFVNGSGSRSNRSPNQQNRNVTERAAPVHLLQDVYIPLTRIDAAELMNNMEIDEQTNNMNDSTEELGLEDNSENILESSQNNEMDEASRQRLEVVNEDNEPEEEDDMSSPNTSRGVENPLEGPSWLLDIQSTETKKTKCLINLEPDSTTELENTMDLSPAAGSKRTEIENLASVSFEYSPTVRRRKRTASPRCPRTQHFSPRRNGINGRVLKVLVPKMKLDMEDGCGVSLPKKAMRDAPPRRSSIVSPTESPIASPIIPMTVAPQKQIKVDEPIQTASRGRAPTKEVTPKRMLRFDAPSPNGATDARVIVSESKIVPAGSVETSGSAHAADRRNTHNNARSNSQETRCNRKETRQDLQESRPDTLESRRNTHMSRRDKHQSRVDVHGINFDTQDPKSDTHESRRATKMTQRDKYQSRPDMHQTDTDTQESRPDTFEPRRNTHESRRDRYQSRLDVQQTNSDTHAPESDTLESRRDTKVTRRDKHQSRPDVHQTKSETQESRSDKHQFRTDVQRSNTDTHEPQSATHESRRDTEVTRRERSTRYEVNNSDSCEARDSDSSMEKTEGRVRRARKAVTYTEKPLNRKLRR